MNFNQTALERLEAKFDNFIGNVESALGNTPVNAAPTKDQENKLLSAFRSLDSAGRNRVMNFAGGLVNNKAASAKGDDAYENFNNSLIEAAIAGDSVKFI